ncbi:hypothetical protein DID88_000507 [Monilinia fructigena]|uniref:FAD-binding PCMH-type domain-containing protein n=1 Tax=Monilinia fructigena TaxID=38457 RepID=A0A395II24_9HELO|nr:hypothetical protein DID88_000507 [Monilinia fructigena]
MTTLTTLKHSLRRTAKTTSPHSITKPLSPTQQLHSFTLLLQGAETLSYTNFIIPHLHDQIASLLQSPARTQISVLEIGPGDKSVLGYLPIDLRRRIRRYVAYEANSLAAGKLEMWLGLGAESESAEVPFPCLEGRAEVMVTFTRGAMALSELVAQVPLVEGERMIKSWEARLRSPAAIVRPTGIQHVRQCVLWALKHHVRLTVLGGGHGGHCLWPNVVAIDMSAFDHVHVVKSTVDSGVLDSSSNCTFWVTVESGCKTEDVVRKTMAAGVVVPLGSRPSVGAGLWLQGGIGHLDHSRGQTPSQHVPADSIRSENERDLLWALKGAGTNFGIVISVTFRTHPAPIYSVRNWAIPLKDNNDAQLWMRIFDDRIAKRLPRHYSTDAYLYWETNQLHLGITMYESSLREPVQKTPEFATKVLGSVKDLEIVNGIGLFETEMYMSGMHGGHGSGKTSSFKRCLFLKNIGRSQYRQYPDFSDPEPSLSILLPPPATRWRAIDDLSAGAAAFGCRNWDFACVITGVWPRDQNGSELAQDVIQWVYNIANKLLPSCNGAFGPNLERLARLKHDFDPYNVLDYACPLPKPPKKQKLIILVTGCSGAGKDYCADIWVSAIIKHTRGKFTARSVSISDATKREYARATGVDLNRLLSDRAYKEQHRPALTKFFQDQVRQRPQLPAEHFQDVVESAAGFDVLFITGMRDEAPVAAFSHLVPGCRVS